LRAPRAWSQPPLPGRDRALRRRSRHRTSRSRRGPLLEAQSFDWVQGRGAIGRIKSESNADH
jgi:hypothetical protein